MLLGINVVMMSKPEWFWLPDRETAVRASLASVAVWWTVFAIPLFRRVPEPAASGDHARGQVLVRDIAEIRPGTMPGQYDRYNMKRQVTLTANRVGVDLGTLTREVAAAAKKADLARAVFQRELVFSLHPSAYHIEANG